MRAARGGGGAAAPGAYRVGAVRAAPRPRGAEHLELDARASGGPLRLASSGRRTRASASRGWARATRCPSTRPAARVQLGADRPYTGPDCPPDMLELGGIPQGDYAPVPFLQSARLRALARDLRRRRAFELGAARRGLDARRGRPAAAARVHRPDARRPAAPLPARSPACPRCCPSGATATGSRATSTSTRTTPRTTSTATAGTASRSTRSSSTPRGRRSTTPGSPTPTSSRTSPGWSAVARGRRAHGRVGDAVGEPRVGRRPDPAGPRLERLHREPAPNYAEGERAGHFVRGADGEPFVARWWMGTGSPVDFTSPEADAWWRAQARRVLELGVEGIKADDGEGYYFPPDVRFADGRTRRRRALALRRPLPPLDAARARRGARPGAACSSGAAAGAGQQAIGMTWGGDQASDFWSLRTLVAATLTAAASGFSNWSHDVGGYLGERLVERCPKELLLRWVQFGCFTPLMQAHGRLEQEPWTYDPETLELYRGYVLLHELLVPYMRAAAATAARSGLPIIRPLALLDPGDPRGWAVADAFGFGPALWVAPVLEDGARERDVVAAARPTGSTPGRASARGRRRGGRARRRWAARCGCAPGRSSSRTRPSMWRRAWATPPRASGRSRRRCGASRAAAGPWRGWPTGRACAGTRASSRSQESNESPWKRQESGRREGRAALPPAAGSGRRPGDDGRQPGARARRRGAGHRHGGGHPARARRDFVTDPWELPARVRRAARRPRRRGDPAHGAVRRGDRPRHGGPARPGRARALGSGAPTTGAGCSWRRPSRRSTTASTPPPPSCAPEASTCSSPIPSAAPTPSSTTRPGCAGRWPRGSLGQLNAQSVTGDHGFEARRAGITLAEQGLVSVAASDAHGPTRPPGLLAAEAQLALSAVGREAAARLTYSSPRRLLARGFPASQKVTAGKHGLRAVASS